MSDTGPDMASRMRWLKSLKDGWLHGECLAPTAADIDTFEAWLATRPPTLRAPHVSATHDGGLVAKWGIHAELELLRGGHRAEVVRWFTPDRDVYDSMGFNPAESWMSTVVWDYICEAVRALP